MDIAENAVHLLDQNEKVEIILQQCVEKLCAERDSSVKQVAYVLIVLTIHEVKMTIISVETHATHIVS